jgi:hypothetical protein
MSRTLSLIWAELRTPTGAAGPLSAAYARAMGGIGHAVAGACVAVLAPVDPLILWGALVVVYWLAKEANDLRRGGRFWDGVEDALMVGLGAWYGAAWWPCVIVGAAVYIMATAAWRRV